MIIIAGSMTFDPADRVDVLASLDEVTEASRRDAGVSSTSGPRTSMRPTRSASSSAGSRKQHFDAHLAQPHEAAFAERNLSRMTGGDRDLVRGDAGDPAGLPGLVGQSGDW